MQQLSKPEPDSFRRRYLPASRSGWLLLGLVFLLLWFGTLQYRSLFDTDEGRYAEIPREMLVSGNWVTPRLDGLKYFEKPALQYWATASVYSVFGVRNWTSRIWTVGLGFGCLALIYAWLARLYDRRSAVAAVALLPGSLPDVPGCGLAARWSPASACSPAPRAVVKCVTKNSPAAITRRWPLPTTSALTMPTGPATTRGRAGRS